MTIREAAARLGISASSVRGLIAAGKLAYHQPSPRRIVLDAADVEGYYTSTRTQKTPIQPAPARMPTRYRCRHL